MIYVRRTFGLRFREDAFKGYFYLSIENKFRVRNFHWYIYKENNITLVYHLVMQVCILDPQFIAVFVCLLASRRHPVLQTPHRIPALGPDSHHYRQQ